MFCKFVRWIQIDVPNVNCRSGGPEERERLMVLHVCFCPLPKETKSTVHFTSFVIAEGPDCLEAVRLSYRLYVIVLVLTNKKALRRMNAEGL